MSPFLCKFILAQGSQVAKIIKQHSFKKLQNHKSRQSNTQDLLVCNAQKNGGIYPWSNDDYICPMQRQSFSPMIFRTRVALYPSSLKVSHITVHFLNLF